MTPQYAATILAEYMEIRAGRSAGTVLEWELNESVRMARRALAEQSRNARPGLDEQAEREAAAIKAAAYILAAAERDHALMADARRQLLASRASPLD